MRLVAPAQEYLDSYRAGLARGFSFERVHEDPGLAAAELATIDTDPEHFLAAANDPFSLGAPLILDGGLEVARLPGIQRWMWDGEVCGRIGYRRVPGATDLPEYCLGHIGYGVVPWRRGEGLATSALAQMLDIARDDGMPWVDLVTDVDNLGSQAVIARNGGTIVRRYVVPPVQGAFDAYQWRIAL